MTSPQFKGAMHSLAEGCAVFPCVPGRKEPATDHGFKDATHDEVTIRQWWTEDPDYNPAIATGKESNRFVVDPDTHHDDCEFDVLERKHGPLPTTRTLESPRGGLHFYFQPPAGVTIKTSHNRLGKRIDVLGEGGYVLTEGSRVDGREYRVVNPAPVAEAPRWLIEFLTSRVVNDHTTTDPEKAEERKRSSVVSVVSVTFQTVEDALVYGLPTRKGQTDSKLFAFNRALKTVMVNRGSTLTPQERLAAFALWYERVKAMGFAVETREYYESKFLRGFKKARHLCGANILTQAWKKVNPNALPPEAALVQPFEKQQLVGLCFQLNLASKGGLWWVSCRDSGRLLNVSHMTTSRWMQDIEGLGVIEEVEPCKRGALISPRYRWIGGAA
jgi:hypothetical protein